MPAPSSISISTLIKRGANISVSAKDYSSLGLESMARECAANSTELTVRDAGEISTISLEAVVRAGQGKVTLVF